MEARASAVHHFSTNRIYEMPFWFQPVLFVHQHHVGFPVDRLFLAHPGKGCDDNLVVDLDLSGSCSVDRDLSASSRGGEGVCGESLSVGNVPDVDLLERHDSGRLHQGRVNFDASLIVDVGPSDSCSVDFAFEQSKLHLCLLPSVVYSYDSLELNDGYGLSREQRSLLGERTAFLGDRLRFLRRPRLVKYSIEREVIHDFQGSGKQKWRP